MKALVSVVTALILSHISHARAAIFEFNGNTAGKPSLQVPFAGPVPDPQPFDPFHFTVSAEGSYSFISTANYDNYVLLYVESFQPSAPFQNLVNYNDDFDATTNRTAGFSQFLSPNTPYVFVNTSYDGAGAFRSTINGRGNVIPTVAPVPAVPEPASVALMLAGMGLVAPLARRRRAAAVPAC